ncbi:LruC domain-containing protein [Flagellimonas sp. DF-77]|uniref:LruC domain-containing protein n=1 Tax=Flagellimonas algarum TaxID=3230298 RepID=UPI003393600F
MKKHQFVCKALFLFVVLIGLNACVKDTIEDVVDDTVQEEEDDQEDDFDESAIVNLVIPEGFEFATSTNTTITINDASPDAIYTVYAYNNAQFNPTERNVTNDEGEPDTEFSFDTDELNQVLFTGRPVGGQLVYTIPTPSYYTQLYVRRKEGNVFSSEIIDMAGGTATYTHSDMSGKARQAEVARFKSQRRLSYARNSAIKIDSLFCVNGSGQLFTVNPLNGNLTNLAAMPLGSYTAAIDHDNMFLYSIGKNSGNPLMRYDMINDSWSTVGNVGMGGPRLDFREEDGLLYFSTGAKVYTIDPTNATVLSTWDINNLDVTAGGDLAFAEDGTLFLSSFGGLYRLDLDNNNVYQATRISADNLPFTPTSMTFDSNGELWLASNGSSSDLIIMDTVTGGWEYIYGPNSDSGINFNRTINDLTTFTYNDVEAEDPDTDGDGIKDSEDEYPEDAEKAFEQFTPSKYGWGTVAFEDLWPFMGDYDFNDTAINYRFVAILNAQNEAVQLEIHFEVTSDGAGLTNAFGIEFESIAPNQVESVTGTVLTEGYINVAANGVEEGQDRAVVILFDNNETMLNVPSRVDVRFTTPLSVAQLGIAPFNSFLIVNRDRGREIHLPNRLRTTLGENNLDIEGINQDPDGNYQTDSRLPWAINIVHDFKVPKERVPVNQAYNFFNTWATSGGTQYNDWYKDNAGYRNAGNLKASQ